jgi:hypothetical protein
VVRYHVDFDSEDDELSDIESDEDEEEEGSSGLKPIAVGDEEKTAKYAGGFTWSCCQEEEHAEGCEPTKYKTKMNIVGRRVAIAEHVSRKRRVNTRPRYPRCENCEERYDINENYIRTCAYHLGMYHAFTQLRAFDAS